MIGATGNPEYRVEDDGLVRWRGLVTRTVTATGGVTIPIPTEALPLPEVVPLFEDWAAQPARALQITAARTPLFVNSVAVGTVGQVINLYPFTYMGTPLPPVVLPHSLTNIVAGLKARMATIANLRVYDFPSSRVEPPAAVISMPDTPYDITLGGRNDAWTFPVWLLVSKADDKASYAEMYPYLEAEGARSIRAAVEADRTLGGAADSADVVQARPQFVTVGGTEFLAIEFTTEVYA